MVSLLIVAGLFVAALSTVSASRISQVRLEDELRGQMLAQALLSEILQQPYAESAGILGLEVDEAITSTRAAFDDVDDYAGWSASPPQDKQGQALAGFGGWTRQAAVVWVEPRAPQTVIDQDKGAKRITVTVRRGQVPVAELVALRTKAWPEPEELTGEIAP